MKREILHGIFEKGPFTLSIRVENGLVIDAELVSDLNWDVTKGSLEPVPCNDLVAVLDEAMDFMAARCKHNAHLDPAPDPNLSDRKDPDSYMVDGCPCEVERQDKIEPCHGIGNCARSAPAPMVGCDQSQSILSSPCITVVTPGPYSAIGSVETNFNAKYEG